MAPTEIIIYACDICQTTFPTMEEALACESLPVVSIDSKFKIESLIELPYSVKNNNGLVNYTSYGIISEIYTNRVYTSKKSFIHHQRAVVNIVCIENRVLD